MIDADEDRGTEDGRGGGRKQRFVGADGGDPGDGQGIPGRLEEAGGPLGVRPEEGPASEHRRVDPVLSKSHMSTAVLIVRGDPSVEPGVAEVSAEVLGKLAIPSEQRATVSHGERAVDVLAKASARARAAEIVMSGPDVDRLKVVEGSAVSVIFPA